MKHKRMVAGLTAVALLTILMVPHFVDVDRFRPQLQRRLASYLGREVKLGHMELSLLAGGARVEEVSIADDPAFHNGVFLQAKSLGVGVSLMSLIFSRSLHVTSLTLEEPAMTAIQSADGTWNFSSLGKADTADEADALWSDAPAVNSFVLDHLKISNATVELGSSQGAAQQTTLKNIDIELKNVSLDQAMSFVLSAHTGSGQLEVEGEAGPLNRDNPQQTPFHASVNVKKTDLAEVAPLASSGLAGILNFAGTIASDGQTVHSAGKASADKLRLAHDAQPASQTVSLQYQMDYNIARQAGVIRNSKILVGKSSAALSGSYSTRGENVVVHMKIAGNQIPLEGVEGVLQPLGIVLPAGSKLRGGTVSANLSLDGPINRMTTSGTAELADSHLAGFDLGSKLSALPGMKSSDIGSDLAIVNLSTHIRVAAEGTRISDFKGEFSGIGSITGEGEVSSSNHLQFKMVAHIASDSGSRFVLNHVGLRKVPNDIPFRVAGTTSMPVIIPDLSEMARNTTKSVATDAGRSLMKDLLKPEVKQPERVQASNEKKSGLFHRLFKRKDKQSDSGNGVQLAAEKTKY